MVEIIPIDKINREDWQTLLANSPYASYFQSPEYFDFFRTLSFIETFGWGVVDNGKLKGIVCGYLIANGGRIKQFFSRRAIIHGGLLLADDVEKNHISELLNTLIESLSRNVIYIEIRNCSNFDQYKSIFQENGFEYHSHLNYKVKTDNLAAIQTRYSESKVRQIRKSEEQGAIFELAVNQNDINGFYRILSELYENKVKKPLFPKEFFEKFVTQPNCYLFVVKQDKTVIGGIACATLQNKAVYEWFVCGDSKNFNHLYPSVFATHKGIEFASVNGFEYFDFMGAGKPNEDYGVRDFKEKFGGELVEYGRFNFISNKFLYKIGKFVIETIKTN